MSITTSLKLKKGMAIAVIAVVILAAAVLSTVLVKRRKKKKETPVGKTVTAQLQAMSGEAVTARKIMKTQNVVFGGTVRDVEKWIKGSLTNIDRCGQKFNDYALILYENDSNDKTRSILQAHKKPNYHYIFEDAVKEPLRTKRLEAGRNKVLDKMREINKGGYYSYFIVIDMDDVNQSGAFVDTIETCFTHADWDVLTGNQAENYYDLWALRKKHDMEFDYWEKAKLEPDFLETARLIRYSYPDKNDLLEVDSAFGGVAIYKIQAIPNHCRYVGNHANGREKVNMSSSMSV